jgi:hypothetical protein
MAFPGRTWLGRSALEDVWARRQEPVRPSFSCACGAAPGCHESVSYSLHQGDERVACRARDASPRAASLQPLPCAPLPQIHTRIASCCLGGDVPVLLCTLSWLASFLSRRALGSPGSAQRVWRAGLTRDRCGHVRVRITRRWRCSHLGQSCSPRRRAPGRFAGASPCVGSGERSSCQ